MKGAASTSRRTGLACLAIFAIVTIVGCSSTSRESGPSLTVEPSRKTVTLSSPLPEYPAGEAAGTLSATVIDGIVYFVLNEDGTDIGLIFPPNFTASLEEPPSLIDQRGIVLGEVGGTVELGGGTYPQGRDLWASGPQVDRLFIVAPRP